MAATSILITAADAAFFQLVRGTILSIRDKPEGRQANVGFFDLGCTPDQVAWLNEHVNVIRKPEWEFDFPGRDQAKEGLKGFLARVYLQKYFPGFDIYFWIDADAYVQNWSAVDLFLRGAAKRGAAVVPELDRASRFQFGGLPAYWDWARGYYESAFGPEVANQIKSYPMLNAGVFAMHKDAPHWQEWANYLKSGLQRAGFGHTDQLALNVVVYGRGLIEKTELLPAWCNWTCHFGLPIWDRSAGKLVEPYLPHTPIGILHMTRKKYDRIQMRTTDGGLVEVSLAYPPRAQEIDFAAALTGPHVFPAGDYVSPGFASVRLDPFFPDLLPGDLGICPWPYIRREIPHTWYVDRRAPAIGFLNRDEAHVLYNTALGFKGKRALEIGCLYGWSACHLALGGVLLDVIDPILARPEVFESVEHSLRAAGVRDSVNLLPGLSPRKVEELATQTARKWSLIFIDGEHNRPGPLQDAVAAERFAEDDCAILFHDLVSPDVAEGLDYLRQRGWQTWLFQTMQIMGIAWRGNVTPVSHQPDPTVAWTLPAHLRGYAVSGMAGV